MTIYGCDISSQNVKYKLLENVFMCLQIPKRLSRHQKNTRLGNFLNMVATLSYTSKLPNKEIPPNLAMNMQLFIIKIVIYVFVVLYIFF